MMKIKWKNEQCPKLHVLEKEGVVYLTYPELEELHDFVHGFSTRIGGVSQGYLSSMNLSYARGDREEFVTENFRRISAALGVDMQNIVMSDQTHTTNVRRVTAKDRGNGITRPKSFFEVDGLITNEPDVVLATFYADCVPLYFVDPVHKAIGLSHSGWRGTAQKIGKVTLEKMMEEFGTDPTDVYTAIGPSICQDCYEVSEDVILQFQDNFAPDLWDRLYFKKENGKYQLNLQEANYQIMLEAGVIHEHISLPNICTCCNPEFLFSHRASKGLRGNLAAFLSIKES